MYVKVENISKDFGGRSAVADLSFEARPGYILGILGPPKAGKTTILRILVDMLRPDQGQISYDDQPITARVRDAIGYLPQERGLYQEDSLQKILVYFARLKNFSRKKAQVEAVRLMDRFGVIDHMEVPVHQLSEELKQKVQLMIAIIHNPDLLIFDEPFSPLKPANLHLMHNLLQRFKDEGKTILLASSDFDTAEAVCDEVVLINNGQDVLQGSLNRILKRYSETLITVQAPKDLQSLKSIYGVKKFVIDDETAHLFVDSKIPPQKILDVIVKSVNVSRIEVNPPGLADVFLQIVQGRSEEEK